MSDLMIFQWLFGQFDTVLNSYVASTSSDIIATITPVAYIMFGIYVVLWGFSMVRGMIDEPVMDGLFRLLKIAIVLGFALGAGRYQGEVVTFFMETPNALANVLVFGDSAPADGGTSTAATLDMLTNRTVDVAGQAWDQMSLLRAGQSIGLAISAILILIVGMIFTVTAGVSILVAKTATVLLLAIGPIFILMLMFKTTQKFFEQWLAQALNYMLMLVLLLAVVSLFLRFCEAAVGAASGVIEDDPLQAVVMVGIVCFTCFVLLLNVPQMASALAGGFGLAANTAVGRMMGGGIGGAARSAKAIGTVALAKVTAGASVAGRAIGNLARASNSVRPG